ncbi:DJ-1/PfpI family protein [Paenibacillus sp. N3/727]|uniref:DJ-1/PfpI family protein n=1 Tax=Paenibacillus sp. N3/727 TaxID=2925845 RepID=UPI001F5367B1|nr:DJ-1/PfpI family protein [Paenibacillus sp. N3/727]UNK20738.1 DJ-1/PfpI family protein [Paenibacillus sp. N3/727]
MKKILLLLADGFEALEASMFTDVFGWNKWEGDGSTEIVTVGFHKKLKCTWNLTIIPEKTISEIDVEEFDALAIPGGFEEADFYNDAFDERFLEIINKSGILTNRNATTYSHPTSHRIEQLRTFGAIVQNMPIVQDGHLITSSNPASGFDVAFLLLEKLTSEKNVKRVKELMGFEI